MDHAFSGALVDLDDSEIFVCSKLDCDLHGN